MYVQLRDCDGDIFLLAAEILCRYLVKTKLTEAFMSTVRIKSSRVPKSKKKVTFKVEIKGELNITTFIAWQRVDQRLFLYVGNMLHSGEPDLLVGENSLLWDVPIVYTLPDLGTLGMVGHILVDAQTGDLKLNESTPVEEMKSNAKRLYQQAAPPAGT